EVRFEDRPGLIERALFGSGRSNTEARVVHEQIDATMAPHHFADRSLHGLVARYVEGQHLERSFEMLPLDVTSDQSVEAAVSEVMRRHGRIDLLVNNAGFGVAPAGAEESSLDQARSIFETNFFGLVRMTRAVVPHMRRQGNGRIINIGSVLGFLPMPYGALYAATKHAVEGYSESLD